MAGKVTMKSNAVVISDKITKAFADAAEQLKEEAVEWVQWQMLYGFHDPHGPDRHTEIVDTGATFESITAQVKRDSQNAFTVTVGAGTPYAPYIELGTRKVKARPFLRNALEQNGEKIKAIMEENLQESKIK